MAPKQLPNAPGSVVHVCRTGGKNQQRGTWQPPFSGRRNAPTSVGAWAEALSPVSVAAGFPEAGATQVGELEARRLARNSASFCSIPPRQGEQLPLPKSRQRPVGFRRGSPAEEAGRARWDGRLGEDRPWAAQRLSGGEKGGRAVLQLPRLWRAERGCLARERKAERLEAALRCAWRSSWLRRLNSNLAILRLIPEGSQRSKLLLALLALLCALSPGGARTASFSSLRLP